MNRVVFFLLILVTAANSSCRKTRLCADPGPAVRREWPLGPVDSITVGSLMRVTLIYSDTNRLELRAGKTLADAFDWNLHHGHLTLRADTECLLRDSSRILHVTLYLQNVRKIIHRGEWPVTSADTLPYPDLTLISEYNPRKQSTGAGDFDLRVHSRRLSVSANHMAVFRVAGRTDSLFVGFYGGMPRFEGAFLHARGVRFIHKSANDILCFPVQCLCGTLYSTGNVVIFNEPDSVYVDSRYTGRLIRAY
ncbi:MAG: hypothetical protein GXO27_05475 [Chlorobi bacterium]|nr:hypothetical protein [Chlorobiota bacterium]